MVHFRQEPQSRTRDPKRYIEQRVGKLRRALSDAAEIFGTKILQVWCRRRKYNPWRENRDEEHHQVLQCPQVQTVTTERNSPRVRNHHHHPQQRRQPHPQNFRLTISNTSLIANVASYPSRRANAHVYTRPTAYVLDISTMPRLCLPSTTPRPRIFTKHPGNDVGYFGG